MVRNFLLGFEEPMSRKLDKSGPPTTKMARPKEGTNYGAGGFFTRTRTLTEVRGEESDKDPGDRSLLAIPR
jgi:hypothetical protein